MTLADWIRGQGMTVNAFADALGEPRETIRKIVYRQRQPSLPLAARIISFCGEDVGLEDLIITIKRKAA